PAPRKPSLPRRTARSSPGAKVRSEEPLRAVLRPFRPPPANPGKGHGLALLAPVPSVSDWPHTRPLPRLLRRAASAGTRPHASPPGKLPGTTPVPSLDGADRAREHRDHLPERGSGTGSSQRLTVLRAAPHRLPVG